ncbi:alpha/beta hydrolase [Desulfonema ishimotonii]|uniref:Alpha/beta hydrolase n=2 Tax=Desulfonema ishimotonii TaxID=45657 RepID=A0A401G0H7_9BACT|nr:alpha/beta hydrolase [Desulfonema ishimotonii]
MAFADVEGERIFTDRNNAGNGPVLVLIHGAGGDHAHWPEALRRLPGVRVYAPDLPGHGQSGGNGRQSVEDYATFVDGLVSGLGLENVTLAGHSLGGAIVQTLALRAPRWLSRIILVGTGARLRVHPDIIRGILAAPEETIARVCQWSFGPTASESLIRSVREGLLQTAPEVIHGDYSACNQFDVTDWLADISLPALVISGDADRMTPLKYGQHLARNIPGATSSVIEGAGHMMGLEKPDALIRCIRAFLKTGPGCKDAPEQARDMADRTDAV